MANPSEQDPPHPRNTPVPTPTGAAGRSTLGNYRKAALDQHPPPQISDPSGQLYQRTDKRMTELGQEYAAVEKRLREHLASAPSEPEQNAGLLEHLPQLGVDLNLLPPDRLRVFL